MKSVTFRRVLKNGVVNFFRNGLVSLATVLVMSLSLLMLATVFMGSVFFNTFIQDLQSKVDVSVYFKKSAPESAILDIRTKLTAMSEVKDVAYVSRAEALKRFLDRHKGEEVIAKSIEVIDDNPFSASLEVSAQDPSKYDVITSFLEQPAYKDLIDIDEKGNQKITYRQNQAVIDKLTSILNNARAIGFGAASILALIAVIIAYNTVRLAIYNSRDEISVMQLVGASSWFIRGPFLIEGFIHGAIATAFTLAFLYPSIWWIGSRTEGIFGGLSIFNYYVANMWQISFVVAVVGLVLGVLSSQLAIRKYLRV